MNKNWLKVFIAVLSVTCFVLFQTVCTLPGHMLMFEGEEHNINIPFPINISKNGLERFLLSGGLERKVIKPQSAGSYVFDFSLMGIPFKSTTVDVVKPVEVIPGGQTVGIKLYINGLLVVGVSDIVSDSKTVSPGKEAGLLQGDLITAIDGKPLESVGDLSRKIQEAGGSEITATVVREGKTEEKRITPAYYDGTGDYKIGVWVRDSAAGIGTITFINPKDNSFAALGHGISDVDTGDILTIRKGEITGCNISSVVKGEIGSPGELRGAFDGKEIGSILDNREDGIFGKLTKFGGGAEPVPIALRSQVHTGEAYIYSNISGDAVEKYSIVIERTMYQSHRSGKGMIIKVTDRRLLDKTGGIVQGMSGSPIIQDGRLAGVVTHVFVSDPTRGYGMFAEWMLESLSEVTREIQ